MRDDPLSVVKADTALEYARLTIADDELRALVHRCQRTLAKWTALGLLPPPLKPLTKPQRRNRAAVMRALANGMDVPAAPTATAAKRKA